LPEGTAGLAAIDPLALAARHLARRQGHDGAWEGEVVWCPIITAEVVLLDVMLARPIAAPRRRLILRHFATTRRPDGGWGLHPLSSSYLFVTTLVYVAARLLGEVAAAMGQDLAGAARPLRSTRA
jgi:Squalene-hopene cyclase N-terminal domain